MVRKICDVEFLKKFNTRRLNSGVKKSKTRQTEVKKIQDPVIFFPTR